MRTLGLFVAAGLASASFGQDDWPVDKYCVCISECEVAARSENAYFEVLSGPHIAFNGMFASGQFNDPAIDFVNWTVPEDFKPKFWDLYSVKGENNTKDVMVSAMIKYVEDMDAEGGIVVWIPAVNVWKDNKMTTITRDHCDGDLDTLETKTWEFGGNPNNGGAWFDSNGDMVRVTISCAMNGLNVRIKKWDQYDAKAKKVTAKKLAHQRNAAGLCVRDKFDQDMGGSQDMPNNNPSCKCIDVRYE